MKQILAFVFLSFSVLACGATPQAPFAPRLSTNVTAEVSVKPVAPYHRPAEQLVCIAPKPRHAIAIRQGCGYTQSCVGDATRTPQQAK